MDRKEEERKVEVKRREESDVLRREEGRTEQKRREKRRGENITVQYRTVENREQGSCVPYALPT